MNENEEILEEVITEPEAAAEAAFRKGLRQGTRRGVLRGVLGTVIVVFVLGAVLLGVAVHRLNERGLLYVTASGAEEARAGVLDPVTLEKLATLSRYIDKYYLYDIDSEAMREALSHALFDSLDENYTHYYSVEEYEEYRQAYEAGYHGIGITISPDDDGAIYVVNTMFGSPAEQAGVQAGDRVISINGTEVTGMDTSDVADLVTGSDLGTQITLVVYRAESDVELTYELTVSEVDYNYVSYSMQEDDIGYIYLSTFSSVSATQFEAAMTDLSAQGMDGLIIDLRYNGGGSLDALIAIAETFLPEGEILKIDYTASGEQVFTCSGENALDIPIVILVNGHTASASEALTGAAQDMGAATILGTQTFGKGIVQSIYQLQDGSAVKLTTAYYYTPSGTCIHGEGITPDIVVEMEPDESGDPQFDAAMSTIRAMMGS